MRYLATVAFLTISLACTVSGAALDDATFVRQLYLDLLDRTADPAGLNFWQNQIITGQMTRAQAATAFFTCPESTNGGLFIVKLYEGALRRDPDFQGWNAWFNLLATGASKLSIVNSFLTSAEFAQLYGPLSNASFVTTIYQNVLGRAPSSQEYQTWVNGLNGGIYTQAQVMDSVIEGSEFDGLIRNRAYANLLFLGFFRRSADSVGLKAWMDFLAGLGLPLEDAVAGFITDPEYLQRFVALAPELSSKLALDASAYFVDAMPPVVTPLRAPLLTARFIVRNTDQPIVLTFGSSQVFDFVIRNDQGVIVYQWSAGKAFFMVVLTQSFGPGEKDFVFQVRLSGPDKNPLPAGRYTAEAWLTPYSNGTKAFAASVAFDIRWTF